MDKEKLSVALESLLFRDNGENIYTENTTNKMILEIAKAFDIEIKNQISVEERDLNISKYRKIFRS